MYSSQTVKKNRHLGEKHWEAEKDPGENPGQERSSVQAAGANSALGKHPRLMVAITALLQNYHLAPPLMEAFASNVSV